MTVNHASKRNRVRQFLQQYRYLEKEIRFLSQGRAIAPNERNQETGFLRQFMQPDRDLRKETRFLLPNS